MAGITDLACRLIMRPFGIGLAFSEMVSANGLVLGGEATKDLLISVPEDRPLGIQLFGENPEILAEACRRIEEHCDVIDINMGCPVKKVVRSGAGSALLKNPARAAEIVAAMRKATSRPLTVKIRAGWDQACINFLEIAHIAEQEGADAVTLHPRTRSQGFSGCADWTLIATLKQQIKIPVIGSGDVFTPRDALRMLEETGCDAVMLGRGCYGNPWLAGQILDLLGGKMPHAPTTQERCEIALLHIDTFLRHNSERKTVLDMRKHLCWYARGLSGAAQFRAAVNKVEQLEELRSVVKQFFRNAEPPAEVS